MAVYFRVRECIPCKHTWTAKVEFSISTQRLSGEKAVYCPKCGKMAALCHPAFQLPLMNCVRLCAEHGLIDPRLAKNESFLSSVRRYWKRNVDEPGDCAGDPPLLMGLAIAEARVGKHPGWIPECEKLGVEIAKLIESNNMNEGV